MSGSQLWAFITLAWNPVIHDSWHLLFGHYDLLLDHKYSDLSLTSQTLGSIQEHYIFILPAGPRAQSLRNGSPVRSSNDMALRKIIEEKTKIEGELVQMRSQLRSVQKEKDSYDEVVCIFHVLMALRW